MEQSSADNLAPAESDPPVLSPNFWIYTNYDCNLSCSYCVAESSPRAARNALDLATVQQVVDQALALGFERLFFTGGEPFILDSIYAMLAYACARADVTVLTNATLLHGSRLDRLASVAGPRLTVQVSLDGGRPEHHDPLRGAGSWAGTVEGIRRLQGRGMHVRLATTETAANQAHVAELHAFRRSLGISDDDHLVRPLAKRGFSTEGLEVDVDCLEPEVTVSADGVLWHPLASPSTRDMLISPQILPLAPAVEAIRLRWAGALAQRKGQQRKVK